jgi:hypothetical protein
LAIFAVAPVFGRINSFITSCAVAATNRAGDE